MDQIIAQVQYAEDDEAKGEGAWKLGFLAELEENRYVTSLVKSHGLDVLVGCMSGFSVDNNVKRQVARAIYNIVQVRPSKSSAVALTHLPCRWREDDSATFLPKRYLTRPWTLSRIATITSNSERHTARILLASTKHLFASFFALPTGMVFASLSQSHGTRGAAPALLAMQNSSSRLWHCANWTQKWMPMFPPLFWPPLRWLACAHWSR